MTPGEKWEVKEIDTANLEQESNEQLEKNEITPLTMLGFLRRGIYGKGYNGSFEKVHNQVLGIRPMTEPDLEELIASIFGTGKLG